MKWHRIWAVIIRHLYETRRNLDRLADTLYWPIMDIVMWGFFSVYLSRYTGSRPGVVSFLLGAIVLWNLFCSFQRDFTVGMGMGGFGSGMGLGLGFGSGFGGGRRSSGNPNLYSEAQIWQVVQLAGR